MNPSSATAARAGSSRAAGATRDVVIVSTVGATCVRERERERASERERDGACVHV